MVANSQALEMAKYLAAENREDDPAVKRVVWFPDSRIVRLLVVSDDAVPGEEGRVFPFHFPASPNHKLPLPSAVAMIRPSEFGRLALPDDWGKWDQAQDV